MSAQQFSDSGFRVEMLSHGVRQMEGSEDAIDAWRSPVPRFMSFPHSSNGGGAYNSMSNSEMNSERNGNGLSSVVGTENSPLKSGGSIAERRAAKFGFDASKISTSRFDASSAMASPDSSSLYLLRTPGISPGALLESPMMLPNLQASPTTGAFGFPRLASESGMIASESSNGAHKNNDNTFSFTFNPKGKPIPFPCYSALPNQYPPTSLAHTSGAEFEFQHSATGVFQFPTQLPSEASARISEYNSPPDPRISNDVKANSDDYQLGNSVSAAFEMRQNDSIQGEDAGKDHNMERGQRVLDSSRVSVGNIEDGYNWRKYGQKQVKASEFPRSYYKCTHPNCPVKKKVEHTNDGQIIEIDYKGSHNHPQVQPNRRSVSCGESLNIDDPKVGLDSSPDNGLERTCSASIITDVSNPQMANEGRSPGVLESAGTPELSSTLASNEEVEEEEDATQASTLAIENEDDEPEFKRRKMESSLIETALASRAIREPRVIVQIESEVDILDDGYRWRKYGQKVVKGNPNPRSYYKCTYPGCSVRKHVERASHNLKFVLTTYEGKHHHEVPSAKNSSHTNQVGTNSNPSATNPQQALSLSQNSHLPKSEPQDFATNSNRVQYNKDFLKANYLPYQLQYPSFPNNMLYSSFGLNPNYNSTTSQTLPLGFNTGQGRPFGMIKPAFMKQPPKEPRQDQGE